MESPLTSNISLMGAWGGWIALSLQAWLFMHVYFGCSILVEAPPTTRRRKGRSSGVQWKSAEPRAATSLRAIIAKSQSVATNKARVPHV